MAGINTLDALFKKKGQKFIKKLFQSNVVVYEKIDGSRFCFEKLDDGTFEFYKRDDSRPITLVDRTLIKFYEFPINFIENLPEHIKSNIPVGFRFGFVYVPSVENNNITYDELPPNKLIITDIIKKSDGKVSDVVEDSKLLKEMASLMGVGHPPIIFEGYLKESQKEKIMEFLSLTLDEAVEKFKTDSFTKFIVSVLNPTLKRTTLNRDLDKQIDALVFRFTNDKDDVVLAKLTEPIFQYQMMKNAETKSTKLSPSDIYSLTVIDTLNFISAIPFSSIELPDNLTKEERYIEFISQAFNQFIKLFSHKYKGTDFEKPEFMKRDGFELNFDNIKNEKTRENIQKDVAYKELFRIMLNAFRKKKKKVSGFFNEESMNLHNKIVDKIESFIDSSGLNESLTFSKTYVFESDIQDYDEDIPTDLEDQEEDREKTDSIEDAKKKSELIFSDKAESGVMVIDSHLFNRDVYNQLVDEESVANVIFVGVLSEPKKKLVNRLKAETNLNVSQKNTLELTEIEAEYENINTRFSKSV